MQDPDQIIIWISIKMEILIRIGIKTVPIHNTLVNLSPAASILCWQRLRLRAAKQTTTKLFYERPKEEVITHVKEVPCIQPRLKVGQNLRDFLDGVCEHKLALLQLKHKESITD